MKHKGLKKALVVCLAVFLGMPVLTSGNAVAKDEAITSVTPEKKPEFTYSPAGRRDPFAPLIQKMSKTAVAPKVNLGPLGKYELGQLRMMAMLVVQGTPRAMVKAPDGKSYTVKLGDLVGPHGGVVTKIETKQIEIDKITGQRIEKAPDRIVVEEAGIDSLTGKLIKEERYIEM
ncbi:Pilus assembly protein, PilP [Malonomonas rubra DSM 5091]|uniref:Pilus assembly protein, PilP n=1 Tax=Malonomonas rubra DSM 5091 TaxID=1122189 RepID=A0A1M6D776_MALRU|nr:pilus assembly protein PilP [Malonomonas rubra]SHI68991.1 Pilus assembly protein, PilP [Malonomonas rubra DSM 5091]